MNKLYCEICRDFVEYEISDKKLEIAVKGVTYYFDGKEATCSHCGMEVDHADIMDDNIASFNAEYRRVNGIVSMDIIKQIPLKYNIKKRPLSLILGWGEHSFTRYYNGDNPTKPYSDELKRVYDDPNYFLTLIETNLDKISSSKSLDKCKEATAKLISQRKIDSVSTYLINHSQNITNLSLQKALYYAQCFFYVFFGKFLFNEDCQAWKYGPVYPDMYKFYKCYGYEILSTSIKDENLNLTQQEQSFLDIICENICAYNGNVLKSLTHKEQPWIDARGALTADQNSTNIIKKTSIRKYFSSVKSKYNIDNPEDIKKYIDAMLCK